MRLEQHAASSLVRPIEWRDGTVVLLDQRRLPEEERYVVCRAWREVAEAIRSMVVRGAPAIGVAAAMGIALAGLSVAREPAGRDLHEVLQDATKGLCETRPTAFNLSWALEQMRSVWLQAKGTVAEVAEALVKRANEIMDQDLRSCLAIGEYGADLIVGRPAASGGPATSPLFPVPARLRDRPVILTHCNAGALATAGYGTALGIVRSVYRRNDALRILADETRPLLQGGRLTAWELQRDGIPVEVITDSMAGYYLACGEVSHVVVGADRIAANGDTANKIGTYGLSVLARHHGVPFVVAAPFSSIDLSLSEGSGIPIEQRSAEEVVLLGGMRLVPAGVPVRNPAFDVTPAQNISAIVTERGVSLPPFSESLAALEGGQGRRS